MNIIGIDVGFGFTKVVADGYPEFAIPSIYTSYSDRIEAFATGELMDNLTVTIDSKKYLVGKIAQNESGIATFDKDNKLRHLCMTMTGIAIANAQRNWKGTLVLGLPISDWAAKKDHLKKMEGVYHIELNNNPLRIEIEKIIVIPQGTAGFYDIILNDKGDVISDLSEQRVGIIDIGEKTLDYVVINQAQLVSSESGSLDYGMSRAYIRLQKVLQKEEGISVLPYQVKQYFNRFPDTVKTNYSQLATEIIDNISVPWNYKSFDKIYIAGGGGAALHQYIAQRVQSELISGAQFSNARGYLKCGKAILKG